MAWQFEKVHEITTPTPPKNIAFDGKYVWITGTNAVYVYEYFSTSEPAFDDIDDLIETQKLVLFKTIAVPNGSHYITASIGSMWVTNKDQFDSFTRISKSTFQILGLFLCPETMNSNFVSINGSRWMVSKNPNANTDRQTLYAHGVDWTSIPIPTRKQLARTDIIDGLNGYLYTTNFNNVAISKFDTSSFGFVSGIRTNAFPQKMVNTQERDLYVGSYAGMLSKVNTLDNSVLHPHSTLDIATSLAHEPGTNYIWFLNATTPTPRLGRLNRSDNSMMFSAPTPSGVSLQSDWELDLSKFSDREFSKLFITPPLSFEQYDGSAWQTVNIKSHLFVIGATKLMAVVLDRPLYRTGNISVEARAMISTGNEDYMGEIAE